MFCLSISAESYIFCVLLIYFCGGFYLLCSVNLFLQRLIPFCALLIYFCGGFYLMCLVNFAEAYTFVFCLYCAAEAYILHFLPMKISNAVSPCLFNASNKQLIFIIFLSNNVNMYF